MALWVLALGKKGERRLFSRESSSATTPTSDDFTGEAGAAPLLDLLVKLTQLRTSNDMEKSVDFDEEEDEW